MVFVKHRYKYGSSPDPFYCSMCGEIKDPSEFDYLKSHPTRPCKPCKQCKSNYHKKRKQNGSVRSRYILRSRAYREDNREVENRRQRERSRGAPRRIQDPVKAAARLAVKNAVQSGRLIKPSHCQDCIKPFPVRLLHGHHDDYSKPLDVVWLCAACHGLRHRIDLRSLTLDQVVEKQ